MIIANWLKFGKQNGANGAKPSLEKNLRSSFYEILLAQHHIRGCHNGTHTPCQQAVDEANYIASIGKEEITWEGIYRLERAMLEFESEDSLREDAWELRNQFKAAVTEADYAAYEASHANPTECTEEKLRTDLAKLRELLNWIYLFKWRLEEFRRKLTERLFWQLLVFSLLLAGLTVSLVIKTICPLALAASACAGLVGGYVSTLQRIQTAQLDGYSDLSLLECSRGIGTGIFTAPILGAVFAMVLFFCFTGKLLSGEIFPTFTSENFSAPLGLVQVAKLIVWSFIAGFAERLVPDRLDQLSQKVSPPPQHKAKEGAT